MFPKRGKRFPGSGGPGERQLSYAESIAIALRDELGDSHQAIKTVMRWTGATDRTAKNWVTGTRGPTGQYLISLARHSDAVFEVFIRAAGRDSVLVAVRLTDARERIAAALETIDKLMAKERTRDDTPKS
jgi:hypothetical protein